jgi:hypothetical protein
MKFIKQGSNNMTFVAQRLQNAPKMAYLRKIVAFLLTYC